MTDECDLFAAAMQDVERKNIQKKRQKKNLKPSIKRYQILNSIEEKRQHRHDPLTAGEQAGTYKASGLSMTRLKKLRRGDLPIDRHLDLHGMTQAAAEQQLQYNLEQALQKRERLLCIIHGRGLHSNNGEAILKKMVYHYLRHGPFQAHILAIDPQRGSRGGACLVLLSRSS